VPFCVPIIIIAWTKGVTPRVVYAHGKGFCHFEPRGSQEYPRPPDIPWYDVIFFSVYSFLCLDSSSASQSSLVFVRVSGHGQISLMSALKPSHDNLYCPPKTNQDEIFLAHQVLPGQKVGKLSAPFSPDLLPGMYSLSMHTISKPSSGKLHMVINHNTRKYSLNSMITPRVLNSVE
jgi:hypothetical protein